MQFARAHRMAAAVGSERWRAIVIARAQRLGEISLRGISDAQGDGFELPARLPYLGNVLPRSCGWVAMFGCGGGALNSERGLVA